VLFGLTGLRINGGRTRELARVDEHQLQPLYGRREASGPSTKLTSRNSLGKIWTLVQRQLINADD